MFLGKRELKERFGIDRTGATLSFDNLVADPRKLAAGLLTRAAERGARFYARQRQRLSQAARIR